jgi:enoyl-CoA hydratase/carnithine racemase
LREAPLSSLEKHLENESTTFAAALGSAEGEEGMRAFIEKRKPSFGGIQ